MTHTDTDIAEILQRFDEGFGDMTGQVTSENNEWVYKLKPYIEDFITRECLALKKKWEREHFDNQ